MQKSNEDLVPVTIYFKRSTIERLEDVTTYLSIKHQQDKNIERLIKDAVANYLDCIRPIPEQDILSIQSLFVNGGGKYAIRNRFKEIMEKKNIKAVQIHRDTGISESNLSQILNNKNLNITLDSFLRIWFALKCPPIMDCLYHEDLKDKSN